MGELYIALHLFPGAKWNTMQQVADHDVRRPPKYYSTLAIEGTKSAIDKIMEDLDEQMTIAESKIIDYALGLIDTPEGIGVMEDYLFHGTQIQRNYCTLYFGRRGDYHIVRKAYDQGLIDAKQAFSR